MICERCGKELREVVIIRHDRVRGIVETDPNGREYIRVVEDEECPGDRWAEVICPHCGEIVEEKDL